MISDVILKLYNLNELLLHNYSNINISDQIKKSEYRNYNIYSIKSLKILQKRIEHILNDFNSLNKENFEIALENEEEILIFKRMYNQVNKFINNFVTYENGTQPLYIDIYRVGYDDIRHIDSIGGSIKNVEENIIANIETKFLFFLLTSNKVDDRLKSKILLNSMFINPYLDDKLSNHKKNIYDYIKCEDNYYNGLDENMKIYYNNYLVDYSFNVLKDIFYNLLSNYCITENDLNIYELYIRTIFNYLDEDSIKKLNCDFNDININIVSKEGKETIKKAFKKIDDDKKLIKNIR